MENGERKRRRSGSGDGKQEKRGKTQRGIEQQAGVISKNILNSEFNYSHTHSRLGLVEGTLGINVDSTCFFVTISSPLLFSNCSCCCYPASECGKGNTDAVLSIFSFCCHLPLKSKPSSGSVPHHSSNILVLHQGLQLR